MRSRWTTPLTACLVGGALSGVIFGQTGSAPLRFDIASVRENRSGTVDTPHVNFPIGSDAAFYPTGGVFSATNLPLVSYILFAYKITNNNRVAFMASLPDWAKTESYNIEARTDNRDVTKEQMREMMRTLLEERFALRAHHEVRTVSAYAAELARSAVLGPSLRRHPANEPCLASDATGEKMTHASGFPVKCGFANSMHTDLPMHRKVGGADLDMATIVSSFSALGNLGKPVVDRTGLTGSYDYTLDYLLDPQSSTDPHDAVGPTFMEALRTELGIKLVAAEAPIDFVIVDHVERPTAN